MEEDLMLSGDDVVTDDLLHLVADYLKDADEYKFTEGPVRLPCNWSATKFQVIVYCKFKGVGEADRYLLLNDIQVN